jgi:hypothetical protein
MPRFWISLAREVFGDPRVGVAVVDHDQGPVGIGLGADTVHGREQEVRISPERDEDLDPPVGSSGRVRVRHAAS